MLSTSAREVIENARKTHGINEKNTQENESFGADNKSKSTTNFGDEQLILDSGTALHIIKNKARFREITGKTVRIKGVSGTTSGQIGYLQDCVLGKGVKALYLPQLPVEATARQSYTPQHPLYRCRE